jgi:Tol biopolymer transport system component
MVATVAVAALAAVVLSACGSSGLTPVSAPQVKSHGAGDLVLVAGGRSSGLGVDNTDLYAATPTGSVRDLTSSPAAENDAVWSADGTHVLFVRQSTVGRRNGSVAIEAGVFVWSPGHGRPQRIASCSQVCRDSDFAWSPDDRHIAFVSGSDNASVEAMNADGSGVTVVCAPTKCGQGLAGPTWSPDGTRLLFSNEGVHAFLGPFTLPSGIWVANADGSGVEKLTQPNCRPGTSQRQGCALDTAPAWSPDGKTIAFSREYTGLGVGTPSTDIEVMRADGSRLRSLYRCSGDLCAQVMAPAWAPDGDAVAYVPMVEGDPVIQSTTLAGKTSTIRTCAGARCLTASELVWSPDGRQLAFFAGGSPLTSDVWVIDRNGTGMHRVARGAECCLGWVGRVSLGGKPSVQKTSSSRRPRLSGSIAYDVNTQTSGSQAIAILTAGGVRGFPIRAQIAVDPAWSPDGREIAFGGQRGQENTNIYVADRDGSNVRVLTHFRHGAVQPAWSPDGRTIAFTLGDGGIELVSASGGRLRRLTYRGSDPAWAPSGRELLFDRNLGPYSEALYTIRPDGHGVRRLTHLPGEQRSPAWSPDGREIAFEWVTPAGESLYLIRPDGTHLHRVTSAQIPPGRPAWSPDGRYLLAMAAFGSSETTPIVLIDVKTGRVSKLRTVPGGDADPSWSPHG